MIQGFMTACFRRMTGGDQPPVDAGFRGAKRGRRNQVRPIVHLMNDNIVWCCQAVLARLSGSDRPGRQLGVLRSGC